MAATEPMALYFPRLFVSPATCRATGEALRAAYFDQAGILMSEDARDRYFELVAALTRAADAPRLAAPSTRSHYAEWITQKKVDDYRRHLTLDPADGAAVGRAADEWRFGTAPGDPPASGARPKDVAEAFRDFVVLQLLTSRLRTALTLDIRGRRRPEPPPA